MSTIPYLRVSEAKGIARDVYEDIMRTYGCEEPHGIYQLMGHTPEFLAASWRRSRHLYGTRTSFSIRDKHIFTLGISATNNCEYCVRIHTSRLMGLGMTAEALVELLMVVDVTAGGSKFAEGTRAGDREVVPPVDDGGDGGVEATLAEIRQAYGNREPDVAYRIMARLPEYLKASWSRARRCFHEEGHLDLRTKHILAYCVAAVSGSDHLVEQHLSRIRELGVTDDGLVELLLIIDLVCGYNRYVQGLQAQEESKPFGTGGEMDKAVSAE
jgi:AhpD family alkylhydroperoxidase